MRVITFKIDDELLRELSTFARLSGRPRSEVIRAALRKYLSEKTRLLRGAEPEPREPVRVKRVMVY